MRLPVLDIREVAERQLCCGCGACAYAAPDDIRMVDALEFGRRPLVRDGADGRAMADAMRVCPGVALEHDFDETDAALIRELRPGWGPVRAMWEGYAADDEIRYAGSSGGAASALALYCIERERMHGLLHIDARKDVPYLNETVLSRTREAILGATGSRYAPASPCDGLGMVEAAPSPCVMIGKPCDIGAAAKARAIRPGLDEKLGCTIAIFCAGAPSTAGTIAMIRRMGFEPEDVVSVRYRGNGWPGMATVVARTPDGAVASKQLTYQQSWGETLQKHRQWRCYVCADHTGEFADISVGDPWYREIQPGEPGTSLVIARTERGRRIIEGAIAAGYLSLERVEPEILPRSQPNLLAGRGAVWGRITALRMMRVPTPRFGGMPMRRYWWSELGMKARLQAFYGTFRRVFTKRLRERHPVVPYEAPSATREQDAA